MFIFPTIAKRRVSKIVSALLAVFLMATAASIGRTQQLPGHIYTFAGVGYYDPPPNSVGFGYPEYLTFDQSGNLYACVEENAEQFIEVIKILPSGSFSVYAGGGTGVGSTGDGGPATQASLSQCGGLAFDTSGNLYISDLQSVRVVSSAGTIHTYTSLTGGAQPKGIVFDASGDLYVSVYNQSLILMVSPSGAISTVAGGGTSPSTCSGSTDSVGDGCAPLYARLTDPLGLAIDKLGNLYIADYCRVRKISGGVITTIAGTGTCGSTNDGQIATSAEVSLPDQMVFDAGGNLYLGAGYGNSVRVISAATGDISTFAGTGYEGNSSSAGGNYYNGEGNAATQENLSGPYGIAIDQSQNVYIADYYGARIQKVISSACITAGNICTVAGNGTAGFTGDGVATDVSLNNPLGLYVDGSSNIFVADAYNNRVREFTVGGNIETIAGNGQGGLRIADNGDGGQALQATINTPGAITEDGAGNLDILDLFANGSQFPVANSDTYSTIRIVSLSTYQISNLLGDTCDIGGCDLTVSFGVSVADFVPGTYNDPVNGNVSGFYLTPLYSDSSINFVSSTILDDLGVAPATYLATDGSGNIFFSSSLISYEQTTYAAPTYTVNMLTPAGVVIPIAGVLNSPTYDPSQDGGPATNASMTPGALAVDAAGDVFIADPVANVVRVVVQPLNTTLVNHGYIYTLAGNAATGGSFCGDGGAATSACLNSPGGIKVDGAGNLYISDTLNNRVREVASPIIPRVVGGHCTTNRSGVTTCTE